jgi:Fe-S-cluster-containing dehydrogenase component
MHRIDQGLKPMCVEACPSKAMIFYDLDNAGELMQEKLEKSEQLLASEGAKPKVSYVIPMNLLDRIDQRVKENPRMDR